MIFCQHLKPVFSVFDVVSLICIKFKILRLKKKYFSSFAIIAKKIH
ncbi:hypothetical protein HMPREF9554_01766 [Treponema phagedenis F0421]|nr:hypothetical protein HMPREF9554_01766 [Treponema phagedenis F0421]